MILTENEPSSGAIRLWISWARRGEAYHEHTSRPITERSAGTWYFGNKKCIYFFNDDSFKYAH